MFDPTYLCQVFDGLRLAGAGGTDGGAPKMEVQRGGEREEAALGERGNHQPGEAAQVLTAVGEGGTALLHHTHRWTGGHTLPAVAEVPTIAKHELRRSQLYNV